MKDKVTVAAAQFHVGDDVAANLRNCLRMIQAAGEHEPQLLVLPEFSNHCSWYTGPEHCREVSVELEGGFLAAVAKAVRRIEAWTVINCSLRRRDRVTGSSILFSPAGEIAAVTDKQVLIGHENDFLARASSSGSLTDTPFGLVGMYACMDGVISETPRCLALRGARILCNSLNSMAFDEGDLHIPVRAAENRVWVVAANKVGPLIPEFALAAVSEAIHIPARFLAGAGDSQIVAPDGAVLARAGKDEQVISAEIDTRSADDKLRADGTDLFASRRPSLYARLAEDPNTAGSASGVSGPERIQAAMVSLAGEGGAAIDEACGRIREARSRGAALICLPALPGSCGIDGPERSKGIIARIAAAAAENCLVATSLALSRGDAGNREEAADASLAWAHVAVLIDGGGVIFEQPLVHACARYAGSVTGNGFATVDTACGRLAVVCGDDAVYPETFRLLALEGVSTVLVPADFLEAWEAGIGLVERAAENRVNIVAASHRDSAAGGLICSLQRDFTITRPWRDRSYDGLLTAPEVIRASDPVTLAPIHPQAAANKFCSPGTHLIDSRPWNLLQAMVAPQNE